MTYTNFDVPTQVKFWDYDGGHYIGGIGYRDEIICGCCGGVFEISEIYEFAPEHIKESIVAFEGWVDINDKIQEDC